MSEDRHAHVERFQPGVVVDTHVHSADFLPGYAATAFRSVNRRTAPPLFSFDQLPAAGVDVIVANAVGDWLVTAWWGQSPWRAIERQLSRIRAQAEHQRVAIAMSAAEVEQAFASHQPAVLLGLEGGNAIGINVNRVDDLFRLGVRVMTPVHLLDNQIGTTCMPWQHYVGRLPAPRRHDRGLTAFGHKVIVRMNSLGMLIDVSHSDTPTLRDILALSTQPVLATHSGAKKIEDFERFLDDDDILGIANTGGLIGLWPYRYKGRGVADVAELAKHARYIADLAGSAHLCIGTDINGVPGMMAGYRGELDVRMIAEQLSASGFDPDEVQGIMGGNFMRVFAQVLPG
jgi:microsomal dipeptidase-like Zn-dependent dipeptidase